MQQIQLFTISAGLGEDGCLAAKSLFGLKAHAMILQKAIPLWNKAKGDIAFGAITHFSEAPNTLSAMHKSA